MRKKDRRRRGEPTGTEPAQPQSTWAHSPGSKCSVRKAGRGLGRNLAHEGLENRVAALVALFFEPLENLLGRIGVLCQQADNLALKRRSEERRVGKEWRSRWSPHALKKR